MSLNEKWKEEEFNPEEDEEIFVGSLDAEALYPSLDTEKVAKLCGKLVSDSGIKIDNVDYRWATTYIAANMTQQQVSSENLQHVIPRRRFKY